MAGTRIGPVSALRETGPDLLVHLVEVLRRYSNRRDLVEPLVDVVRRIESNDQENEPGLDEPHVQTDGRPSVADRLQADGVASLIEQYRCGATAAELAEKYSVSLSSVKRILRANGARKQRVKPAE